MTSKITGKITGATLFAALSMSGCVATTPYPARFAPPPTRTATDVVTSKGPPARPAAQHGSRAETCANAEERPGERPLVTQCLRARAWSWERRGIAIRRQNYLAGSFALPAGAATVGLAAGSDPRTDIIVPLGLLTATYLAHTNAYARADQAVAYEKTTAAYACLVDAATEWAASSKEPVGAAHAYLTLASTQTRDAVSLVRVEEAARLATLGEDPKKSLDQLEARLAADAAAEIGRAPGQKAAIEADVAKIAGIIAEARGLPSPSPRASEMDIIVQQLDIVHANAKSQAAIVDAAESRTGSRLLKRASDIDNLARAAVSAIQPAAQAVAISGAASIKAPVPSPTPLAGIPDTKVLIEGFVGAKAVAPCPTVSPALSGHARDACKIRDELKSASQKSLAEQNLTEKVKTFNAAQASFKQAVDSYAPADPNLGQQCTATFGDLAPLMGPTEVVQAVDHKAQFLISGGVAPYGFLPQDEVKITLTPISSNMARIEVVTPAKAGSWPIVLFDARATPGQLTVTVESKS
jgi:hypothetical protein